jgi:hypothetical protein
MTLRIDRRGMASMLCAVLLCGLPGCATKEATRLACPNPAEITAGFTEPLATVRYLADDALEGRMSGSDGEHCAGEFIAARMASIGLRGAGEGGSYFQHVPLASTLQPHAPQGTGRNVVGLLEGSDPSLKHEIIVIGAHYDHLGWGAFNSLDSTRAVHNGADDNASGVSAMLRVASLLAQGQRPARSVLFTAFTGEELGLLGSAYFVRSPTIPLRDARAMINMDMVGRLGDAALIVYGVGTAREWPALLQYQAGAAGVRLAEHPEGYGFSDHTSFYAQGVPVLHLFTNVHADYHKPTDDWQKIDAAGIDKVAAMVTGLARVLGDPAARLTFVPGEEKPARMVDDGSRAYLGTVPDFSPVPRGVLLSGVTPGSPGDRAGMRRGDILIRLGGQDIRDLQGFTKALQAHRPGDEVDVGLLREGQEITLRAVLGRRGARSAQ